MQTTKPAPSRHPAAHPADTGFSLIEVLIALLVLSIGLLGLAMLQIQGFKFIGNSYQRTQATILANDIIDRIRANREGATLGDYCLNTAAPANPCKTISDPGTADCGDTPAGCISTQALATYDINHWYRQQARYLPNSGGTPSSIERSTVAGTNIFEYKITIRWMERELPMSQEWKVQL
jgi:type IV pilus assembly protein PilV